MDVSTFLRRFRRPEDQRGEPPRPHCPTCTCEEKRVYKTRAERQFGVPGKEA